MVAVVRTIGHVIILWRISRMASDGVEKEDLPKLESLSSSEV